MAIGGVEKDVHTDWLFLRPAAFQVPKWQAVGEICTYLVVKTTIIAWVFVLADYKIGSATNNIIIVLKKLPR